MSSNVDDTMATVEDTTGQQVAAQQASVEPALSAPSDDDNNEPNTEESDSVVPPAKPQAAAGDNADEEEAFTEDGRADDALDFVVDVLTRMKMDCTVDLMENSPDEPPSDIHIEVTGRDASRIIGRKGQTLAALQFLTSRVINRPPKKRRHILIDAEGYRSRREEALSQMATKLGKQAISEGKIITFEPMSAQDRRIVHLALAKSPGLVTKSEGKGASRRVQIIPVRD